MTEFSFWVEYPFKVTAATYSLCQWS